MYRKTSDLSCIEIQFISWHFLTDYSYLHANYWTEVLGNKVFGISFENVTSHNKRYLMSTFENVEIFAACERVFSKHSNATNAFWKLNCNFWGYEKKMVPISHYFLIFYKLFCSISLNKPGRHRYLMLWYQGLGSQPC